jgi:Tol biopolymer transport system component
VDALAEHPAVRCRIERRLAAGGLAVAAVLACLAGTGCSDDGTAPSDTTPPTVELTSPAGGATVTGTIKVSAAAFDASGIEGVQFWLDDETLGAEDRERPFEVEWNTGLARDGIRGLWALARDAAGLTAVSSVVEVEVYGPPGILTVNVTLGGTGTDPDGFTLFFNGFEGVPLAGAGSTTLSASQGPLVVSLENVAPFCDGAEARTVVVPSGGTASVTFDLECIEGPGGVLAYEGWTLSPQRDIVALDMTTGRSTALVSGANVTADLSPDGTKLAYIADGTLHIAAADGSNAAAVAALPAPAYTPHWSPDGTTLVFTARRGEAHDLYLIDASGANLRPLFSTVAPDTNRAIAVWSTAGRLAYLAYRFRIGRGTIWTANPDGSGAEEFTDGVLDVDPAWSPDGSRLAFVRSGESEAAGADVYVIGADGSGLRRVTNSADVEFRPVWSPDGEWLAFGTRTDRRLIAVPVGGGPARVLDDSDRVYFPFRWVGP